MEVPNAPKLSPIRNYPIIPPFLLDCVFVDHGSSCGENTVGLFTLSGHYVFEKNVRASRMRKVLWH
jgi:hypothetical protein